MVHRLIWGAFGSYLGNNNLGGGFRPDSKAMVAVQGLSAVMASGVSAIVTMPLDTIKTRLQVLDLEENGRRRPLTFVQTVRNLVKEGGLVACYRGNRKMITILTWRQLFMKTQVKKGSTARYLMIKFSM